MKFTIGDTFIAKGIEVEVVYINNGYAWVAPLTDEDLRDGLKLFKNCSIGKVDTKGKLEDGSKIVAITKFGGAV